MICVSRYRKLYVVSSCCRKIGDTPMEQQVSASSARAAMLQKFGGARTISKMPLTDRLAISCAIASAAGREKAAKAVATKLSAYYVSKKYFQLAANTAINAKLDTEIAKVAGKEYIVTDLLGFDKPSAYNDREYYDEQITKLKNSAQRYGVDFLECVLEVIKRKLILSRGVEFIPEFRTYFSLDEKCLEDIGREFVADLRSAAANSDRPDHKRIELVAEAFGLEELRQEERIQALVYSIVRGRDGDINWENEGSKKQAVETAFRIALRKHISQAERIHETYSLDETFLDSVRIQVFRELIASDPSQAYKIVEYTKCYPYGKRTEKQDLLKSVGKDFSEAQRREIFENWIRRGEYNDHTAIRISAMFDWTYEGNVLRNLSQTARLNRETLWGDSSD